MDGQDSKVQGDSSTTTGSMDYATDTESLHAHEISSTSNNNGSIAIDVDGAQVGVTVDAQQGHQHNDGEEREDQEITVQVHEPDDDLTEATLVDIDIAAVVSVEAVPDLEAPKEKQLTTTKEANKPAFGKPQWFMVALICLIVVTVIVVISVDLNNYYETEYQEQEQAGIEFNKTLTSQFWNFET